MKEMLTQVFRAGESKRIEIATVLSRENAKILVFDEPEAGIDLWSFTSLIDAFQNLKRKRKILACNIAPRTYT